MTETAAMPPNLVDNDHIIRWTLVTDTVKTYADAVRYFANEWGVDRHEVRAYQVYMRDPGPLCDCEDTATCGVLIESELGQSREMTCADCQTDALSPDQHDGNVTAITLDEAKPYDGWDMVQCEAGEPGATLYWRGTDG